MIGALSRRLGALLVAVALISACAGGDSTPTPPPMRVATSVPTAPSTPASTAPTPAASTTAPPSPTGTSVAQDTSTVEPVEVELLGHQVTAPRGLAVSVFAEGLGAPRFMALDDQGVVYVADRAGRRIVRLPDADGDGVADSAAAVLHDLNWPHSLAFHDGYLYVAETHEVVRSRDADSDGVYDTPEVVVPDLPTGGHWSRTIVFGPDGMLYLSIGSSCNVCDEDDNRRAAVLRYTADGLDGELFSTGLRNAVGLAFDASGRLWATNNGRDGMGDDVPPETINLLTQGADFGWPRCHSGDIPDPDFAGDSGCDGVTPPAVTMQAHSAPLGLAFAGPDTLGGAYDGSLLVAFHGSWNRSEPTGYKVVLLPFVDGQPTGEVIDFLAGFLLDDGESWARPVDVLPLPDGSVLVSDDAGGRIFRVSVDE